MHGRGNGRGQREEGQRRGLHIRHAEEETEIKRRERGGKKEKADTQDFPGTKKARVKDQNDREKGGD